MGGGKFRSIFAVMCLTHIFSDLTLIAAEEERVASACTSFEKEKDLSLTCPPGSIIEVLRAFHGYWTGDKELCYFQKGDCKTPADASTCKGNSCSVKLERSSFSGDCFRIHDYMQVEYKCVDDPDPEGEKVKPKDCKACSEDDCAGYRGKLAKTVTGKDCLPWAGFEWNRWAPSRHPVSGLDSNYCRNPSGHDNAWCFVTNNNKRGGKWEDCPCPTDA